VKVRISKNVRDNIAAAILLFVVVTLAFAPYAYGDRTLMSSASDAPSLFLSGGKPDNAIHSTTKLLDPGAAAWQTEPLFVLERNEIFKEHAVPLWNPYSGFGQPLAADMQSQPFFPLAWIAIGDSSPRGYNWFVILRFYFAALFMFLYLRYFVGWMAAVAGAIGFAFTGYFVLYENITHLSVECLTPAVLWAMEGLLRRRTPAALVVLAVAISILIFGGMPESALLAFSFAYLYFAVRVITSSVERARWRGTCLLLVCASLLGAGIAACEELPFLEFLRISANTHSDGTAGAMAQPFSLTVLASYVVPLIYGPPYNNIFTNYNGFTGVQGWWGVAQVYFGGLAIIGWAGDRERLRRYFGLPVFFFAVAGALLLKRFGNPLVNWIGVLPVFRLVAFTKYEEPIIGFCLAVLMAFGVNELASGRVKPVTAWLAAFLPLAFLTIVAAEQKAAFETVITGRFWYLMFLTAALLVLAVLIAITWYGLTKAGSNRGRLLAALSVAIVVAESVGSYIIPVWYVTNEESPLSRAPIYGSPYIGFLQDRTSQDRSRFFGEDYLLFPQWAAAYGISDIRDLDALYDYRYLPFLRAFIPPGTDRELVDRYTGRIPLNFIAPSERRFLTLSSIKYVGTQHPLGEGSSLLSRALLSQPADVSANLYVAKYSIAGSQREAVVMAPPRRRYAVPVTVPPGAHVLHYSIGMDPAVSADPSKICGDGVTFEIELLDASGKLTSIARRYIDPKHRSSERRWLDASANVRAWAGQPVRLLFSTSPGPSGLTCDDWALWSSVNFDIKPVSPFKLVYDSSDAKIYQYADALPRLSLYANVVNVKTDDEALARIADPAFDPFKTAVVLDDQPAGATPAASGGVTAGRIQEYSSQHVRAFVDVPVRSLAMLDDTIFPGWQASIDGHGADIIATDYMFRGVWIPPGKHVLTFDYRPRSFSIGVIITLLSIVVSLLLLIIPPLREHRLRRA
jgi:hypothetical protein